MSRHSISDALKHINFQRRQEKELYKKSINYLLNDENRVRYLILYETIQKTCSLSILQKSVISEDQKSVAYIGARVFNNGSEIYRCTMSGYYQIAMSLIRDLIEIQFLLDYFRTSRTEIAVWRNSSNNDRYKNFGPHVLYKKLNERDDLTEENKKRKETYQMFCEYAAHVSFPGLKLIANNKGEIQVGAFYDEHKLFHSMVELTRRLGHAVLSVICLLPNTEIAAIQAQVDFMEYYGEVFSIPLNNSYLQIVKKNLEEIQY